MDSIEANLLGLASLNFNDLSEVSVKVGLDLGKPADKPDLNYLGKDNIG